MQAAQKYGFDAVAKKYLDNSVSKILLPAIVHVHYENGLNHFICLYEVHSNYVIVMDPAKGIYKMAINDFSKVFTGVVIELSPKEKIVYFEKNNSLYNLFINIIRDNRKLLTNILVCSIILTFLTIIYSFYFKTIYKLIEQNTSLNMIIYVIYLFLIFLILKLLFDYFKTYYENHINKNIDDLKNIEKQWIKIFKDVRNYYSYYRMDRMLNRETIFEF